MSTSRARVGTLVLAVALCPGLDALQPRPGGLRQREASAALMDVAATGSTAEFARAMAREGIAGGVVLASRLETRPTPPRVADLTRRPGRVGDALDLVAVRQPGLLVSELDDTVFVRPATTSCTGPLATVLTDLRLDGPVFAVGYELAKRLNPSVPSAPPALMGAGQGHVLRKRVGLYFSERTLKQALDEVSRQAPGVVWALSGGENPKTARPECLLYWFTADGGASTFYDLLGRTP